MRSSIFAIAAIAGLAIAPAAFAEEGGAAAGAATGAVTGAVVGGPIGAVVGGVAGAAIGDSATGPNRRDTVVVERPAPCGTTTVRRENAYGDSKTVTRSDC